MLLSVPLLLILNVILARNLSTEEFGYYSFVLSTAAVLSIPVTGGLPLLLTRQVSLYNQNKEWSKYRASIRSSWKWVTIFSAALVFIWTILALFIGRISVGTLDLSSLLCSVVMVPFLSLVAIHAGIIRGFGHPVVAALPAQVGHPITFLIGILTFSYFGRLDSLVAITLHISALALMLLALIIVVRLTEPRDLNKYFPDYSIRREWFRSTLSFCAMSASVVISTNLVILMLGVAGQQEAVAYMRVAERGAQLISFPILMIDGVIAPKVVAALVTGQNDDLKKISRTSARIASIGAAGIAIIIIAFGKPLIAMTFGMEYSDTAYVPMIILITAHLLYALSGSPGLLLAMAKFEKQAIIGNLIGLVAIFSSALLLIADYGAVGAAISVSIGMILSKSYLLIMVRRKIQIWAGVL